MSRTGGYFSTRNCFSRVRVALKHSKQIQHDLNSSFSLECRLLFGKSWNYLLKLFRFHNVASGGSVHRALMPLLPPSIQLYPSPVPHLSSSASSPVPLSIQLCPLFCLLSIQLCLLSCPSVYPALPPLLPPSIQLCPLSYLPICPLLPLLPFLCLSRFCAGNSAAQTVPALP